MEQAAFITMAASSAAIIMGYGVAKLESKFRAYFPKREKPDTRIHNMMPNW